MLTALASLAIGALGASAAQANVTWAQGSTSMAWKATSASVKLQGGTSVSCSTGSASGETHNEETTWGIVANDIEGHGSFKLTCSTKAFGFHAYVEPWVVVTENHEYDMGMFDSMLGTYQSPFGEYIQDGEATGVYVDGSGTTPSTLTFKEAVIGHLRTGNTPVLLTATFKVTTGSGGLLTLVGHF